MCKTHGIALKTSEFTTKAGLDDNYSTLDHNNKECNEVTKSQTWTKLILRRTTNNRSN